MDMEEIFQTTPELSALTEQFFEALLEQRNPETPATRKPKKMITTTTGEPLRLKEEK